MRWLNKPLVMIKDAIISFKLGFLSATELENI